MQHATELCQYPEIVCEHLRMELNFTHPLELINELFVLGKRVTLVAAEKFGVGLKKIYIEQYCFPADN